VPLPAIALLSLFLGAEPASPSQPPPEVQQLLVRELEPLPAQAFSTPGGLAGKVEAVQPPALGEADEGRELLAVSIGTAQPVACTLIPDRVDVGATIHAVARAAAEKVRLVSFRTADILAVQGSPLFLFEIFYAVESEKGKQLGHLKVGMLAHDGHSLVCQHDEPGYGRTFQRLVQGLAASLTGGKPDPRAASRFAEVVVIRIEALPVGYEERVIWDAAKGGRRTAAYGTMVIPRTPVEFVTTDMYREEESDAAGLLLSGAYSHLVNGEPESQVSLKKEARGKGFVYQGKKGEKELSGRFPAKKGLATELWFAKRFDEKRGFGPKGAVKHPAYVFNADPTAPLEMSYQKIPSRPRGVDLTMGPMRMRGELDEAGLVPSFEMAAGSATMRARRAWSRGTP